MEVAVLTVFFLISVSAEFEKHVFVNYSTDWHSAQSHCRDHYVDLSPINSEGEEKRPSNRTFRGVRGEFWVGLYQNGTEWMWSGGGKAANLTWADGQPDGGASQSVAGVCFWQCRRFTGLHNVLTNMRLPFFCYNLIIPQYERTWEQALQYCKNHHTTLASLASETENLLTLSKIKQLSKERVWIGLRFLADQWLWVDREPLEFQAWTQVDQEHQCPMLKRCGTLTKQGVWESWDCQDKLNFLCY